MDVWFKDGTTQGVGYPFVLLTREQRELRYELLFLLLFFHVCNTSLASTSAHGTKATDLQPE